MPRINTERWGGNFTFVGNMRICTHAMYKKNLTCTADNGMIRMSLKSCTLRAQSGRMLHQKFCYFSLRTHFSPTDATVHVDLYLSARISTVHLLFIVKSNSRDKYYLSNSPWARGVNRYNSREDFYHTFLESWHPKLHKKSGWTCQSGSLIGENALPWQPGVKFWGMHFMT